jgi:hypothetical protein
LQFQLYVPIPPVSMDDDSVTRGGWARKAGIATGLVAKTIPFHNQTSRTVYLFWTSDKNSQQTNKFRVDVNAGVDGAGGGYECERVRKLQHEGELSIRPGKTLDLAIPTGKIFVTISSESGTYTGMPPCIFTNRMFSAKDCAGYTIQEDEFEQHAHLFTRTGHSHISRAQ